MGYSFPEGPNSNAMRTLDAGCTFVPDILRIFSLKNEPLLLTEKSAYSSNNGRHL